MREFFKRTANLTVRLRLRAAVVAITANIIFGSAQLSAQNSCDSTGVGRETELSGAGADYARLTELSTGGRVTPRLARRLSNSMLNGCTIGPWSSRVGYVRTMQDGVNVLPLSSHSTFNSRYPEDRNNGALWSGRGVSTSVEGGALFRFGSFTAAVLPTLTYQGNGAYETLPAIRGNSPFANGLEFGLDAPHRFGDGNYSVLDPGQSFVRLDVWKLGVGLSNENVWWGPGFANAILFSNTAPGFPHAFINMRTPASVGIGKLSGEVLWGRLSESSYFDTLEKNNHRMIVGALLTLEPKPVPGLFLGFGRTFVVAWDSVSGRNLFPFGQPFLKENFVTPENPQGDNSDDDQRVSFMARYVLPGSGFEVYGEWAREDASWDATDLIQEPEHSSARSLGMQKLFKPRETRWVRAYLESTNLQILRATRLNVRSTGSFYLHDPQGHTQRGQLLGASIGPGGESQLFGVDVLGSSGLLGFYVERVRRDEFSPMGIQAWSTTWPPRHDVALTGGVRFTRMLGVVRLDSDFALSRRRNRNFIRDESNARMDLRLSWTGKSRGEISQPGAPPAGGPL